MIFYRFVTTPVTISISSIPEFIASSIIYCSVGLSTIGNIYFGCDLVAGKNLVPSLAAGIIDFLNVCFIIFSF